MVCAFVHLLDCHSSLLDKALCCNSVGKACPPISKGRFAVGNSPGVVLNLFSLACFSLREGMGREQGTAQVSGNQVPDLALASCEVVLCFSATALQNEKKKQKPCLP